MRAYFIDAHAKRVSEVQWTGLKDLQKAVGGYIEMGWSDGSGDTLFVNEEGWLNQPDAFFIWRDNPLPTALSAILVGPERFNEETGVTRNDDPTLSLSEVEQMVRFLTRDEAASYCKANASEPRVSITTFDDLGNPTKHVISTMRDIWQGDQE